MLSKRLKDRTVEEEAKDSVGIVNIDGARQIMDACTVRFLDMHGLVVRQWFWRRGRLSDGIGGLRVRNNVVDIIRSTIARHSSVVGA